MTATLAVDTTGLILMWSRDAEALLGYAEAEAVGRNIELIIPPHLRGRHHAGFGRYVQTGVSHLPEVTISPALHKSGTIVKVQVSVQGGEVRVAGKKRDDLQAAIALVRGLKIEQPLQYVNFRE